LWTKSFFCFFKISPIISQMNPAGILVTSLVLLAAFLFFQALYDLFYKRKEDHLSGIKLLWVIALFLFPILGPIVYFQLARER